MVQNIIKWYDGSSNEAREQGANWYYQANHIATYIANKFNVPVAKVCGVIAALSPATNWVQNIADAHNLILAWVNNIDPREVVVGTYGKNKIKAIQILTGPSGTDTVIGQILLNKSRVNKTASFYWNILYPRDKDHVTIDRHAFRIVLDSPQADEVCMTEKRYRSMVEAFKLAAEKLNVEPQRVQATTWLNYREQMDHNVPATVQKLDPEIQKQIIG